ncbi:unnamed protein product [Agarophyton chilense]
MYQVSMSRVPCAPLPSVHTLLSLSQRSSSPLAPLRLPPLTALPHGTPAIRHGCSCASPAAPSLSLSSTPRRTQPVETWPRTKPSAANSASASHRGSPQLHAPIATGVSLYHCPFCPSKCPNFFGSIFAGGHGVLLRVPSCITHGWPTHWSSAELDATSASSSAARGPSLAPIPTGPE